MSEIILTVALPIWQMADIAWLPLEGLIRQEAVDFKWELIIAEEREGAFGLEEISKYKDGLREKGCAQIKYIGLEQWTPLSKKWFSMGLGAAPTSKYFLLHGADSYSPSRRLRETKDIFEETDCDWVDTDHSYWYEINMGKYFYWHSPSDHYIQQPLPRCMYMALRTDQLREVATTYKGDAYIQPAHRSSIRGFPRKSVDGWLGKLLRNNKPSITAAKNESDNWKTGLETNGQNKISTDRHLYMKAQMWPFNQPIKESTEVLESRYDKKILQRLRDIKTVGAWLV
jgi:hypothetical protein